MDIKSAKDHDNFIQTVYVSGNKDLIQHGISFHWWNSEETSMHGHTFYEFFIITQGQAFHSINGELHELKKGTLHMIKPEDYHKITAAESGCIHMNICITEEKLRAVCSTLGITLQALRTTAAQKIMLSVEDTEFFVKRAKRISLISHSGTPGSHVIMSELVTEAVAMLYNSAAASEMNYPDWFTEILEKIHSPEYIGCSAADVYRIGGFSAPAMIEYFRLYTGKTVVEYIRSVKMEYAMEALRDTDVSVIELSNLLGYASLSHFSRIFRQYAGLPPAAYRKSKRGTLCVQSRINQS